MKKLATILVLTIPALARAQVVDVRPWEHESSDIAPDESIRFGQLDNGLRYAWAANAEPDQRLYVRLHVDVGSLAEEEGERGMAHFLEHMAFNGSANFEPGTLIHWFQEHGMSFGADTNAHTSFSETVYKLDLPSSDAETLRSGLTVLRDFADRLLLEEQEIQDEKGVIDAEQRDSNDARFRMLERQLELMYAGTHMAVRLPIGVKQARDEFDQAKITSFYRKWYRPDRMTLVAVGDLGELDPEPLFREAFGDMPAPTVEPQAEPGEGQPEDAVYYFAIAEPEIPTVSVSYERLTPYEEKPMNSDTVVENLPVRYAREMVNLRFSELAKLEEAPFLSAGCGRAGGLGVYDGESLGVVADAERWEEAFRYCERELRRALEFGFRQSELDEVRANRLRALDQAVERAPTRHSLSVVARLLSAAEDRVVPTAATTSRELLRPAQLALTVEDCHEAFREAWSEGREAFYATGNLPELDDAKAHLEGLLAESRAVEVEKLEETEVSEFAYASSESKKGEIADREHVEDLDFHTVRFANGVCLNVKSTDFKDDQIIVGVRIGDGELSIAPEKFAVSLVANQSFGQMGLEAHSSDDLRRLTAGRQVGVSFSVQEDRFVLGGSTDEEDLLYQFELLCAFVRAPGWREEGMRQFQKIVPQYYQSLESLHQGPIQKQFFADLYSGDPRSALPAQAAVEAVTIDDVRACVAPQLAASPIEITVVGDVDVDAAVDATARTFATLPERSAEEASAQARAFPAAVAGLASEYTVATQSPQSLVLVVFPATDGMDAHVRRRFNLLAQIVSDRLREELRERLGAAYSPGASSQLSRAYQGRGLLTIQVMADPAQAEVVRAAAVQVVRDMFEEGVTEDEINRLREPLLNQLRDGQRTNAFWASVLDRAQREPGSLDEVRALVSDYESITAEDLYAVVRKYLDPEKASTAVVSPR